MMRISPSAPARQHATQRQATSACCQQGPLAGRMIAAFAHSVIKAPTRRMIKARAERLRFAGLWLAPLLSLLLVACQTAPSAPTQESPVKHPLPAELPAQDDSGIPSGTPIDEMPLPEGEFSFAGGDGATLEKAVIVNAPTERIGVAAVYGWIGRHYPGSTAAGQNTVIKNGHFYDAIDVITGEKERRTFYFDITQFFGKN
jgi:hypothetical protein